MRILVTGGAGYLGSVLVRRLLQEGHEITVVDKGYYGLKSLKKLPILLIKKDVQSIRSLKNIDVLIHLASIVGDAACRLSPGQTVRTNVYMTEHLAKLCKKHNVKMVYASTCSVYGKTDRIVSERVKPRPASLYGWSKLFSENIIRNGGCDYVILRLGTLFGMSHRMRFDLAVNLFIAKALSGEMITVYGGQQYRPFLHVKDAAEAFSRAIDWRRGIYNVALTNFQIIDVAKAVAEYFGVAYGVIEGIKDERDYIVSLKKSKRRFMPRRGLDAACAEIENAYDFGIWKNYKKSEYSNHKALFKDTEFMKRVYTLGPILPHDKM